MRVGRLATYLLEHGHDVRVLTASPLPYPRTLAREFPSECVIETTSADPFAWLAARRARSAVTGAAMPRTIVGGGWKGRLLRSVGAIAGIPEPQVGWLPYAVSAGRRLFETWVPDAIYASALPFTAHLVADRLSKRHRIPWVAEFRDHFAGNPYSNLPAWRDPIDRWIERRVVASASAFVTVSQPMADTLVERYGKPTVVVLNGLDARAVIPDVDRAVPRNQLRIVYTGVIYPGRRDPSPLFEAIRMMGDQGKLVTIEFYGQDLRTVDELARRYGVEEQVLLGGAIPHRDALVRQRAADLLLLLLWSDPREVGVYTGKLFEYVGSRRPILAVGGMDGVAADLIRGRALGKVAVDPQTIAGMLRAWLDEKEAHGWIADPPDEARVGLSRDEQFANVHGLLEDMRAGQQVRRNSVPPLVRSSRAS